MQDIISEVTTLKASNATLAADHKAATELLESVNAEYTNFKAEADTAKATVATQLEQINELTSKLNASGNELGSVKAELEALKASQQTAEQKAVAIVASQGVAPMPVKAGASEALTKAEAAEHYKALLASNPLEAGKYYQAHKSVINGR